MVANILQARKDYRDNTAGKPGHGLGSPDGFVWRAVVKTLMEDETLPADKKQLIQQHAEVGTPAYIQKLLGHARMYDTYKRPDKPKQHRLELGGRPELLPLFDIVSDWVTAHDGVACSGKAPRTHNEREMAKLMEGLKLWKRTSGGGGDEEGPAED